MSGRFDGRTALVTGGASGIGRATVDRLAAEGARVVAADVNAELLERLADSANADAVVPVAADISTEAGAVTLIGSALEALGHLDVLENAAGILAFAHTVDHSLSDWERVLAVNLTGTIRRSWRSTTHLPASQEPRAQPNPWRPLCLTVDRSRRHCLRPPLRPLRQQTNRSREGRS